ncbi:MAG: hypothetical protein JXB05_11630 [Myxococcaceae bacterium]|nr:hypothetical protein [Myxococcaceae bacterium]
MPTLSVVGLGFGAGEQLTLRGHDVLSASGWIGFFGLPPPLAGFLHRYGAEQVDLDALLASHVQPYGFTPRAAQIALQAAWQHGRAAVAVAGHPCFANAATSAFAAFARQAGVHFELVAAPSILDAFAERTGTSLVPPGATALDARLLLSQGYTLEPRLALVLWDVGYLSHDERFLLGARLLATWGNDWSVSLFRAGATWRPDDLVTYPLAQLELWLPAVGFETTVVVPPRPLA